MFSKAVITTAVIRTAVIRTAAAERFQQVRSAVRPARSFVTKGAT